MISPAQCRAARGLLDLTQRDLAARARCRPAAVIAFEKRATPDETKTSLALAAVLMAAGVRFVEGGVILGDRS